MQSSDPSKDVLMDNARDASLNDATPTSPIFDLSRNCMKKYQALCGMLCDTTRGEANRNSFDRDEVLLGVQDAQYRFKAWATNIAALQESHLKSSLDFRLQEATEIRERVLKILEDLRGSLTDATSIVVGDRANETWEVGALSDSEEDEDSVSTSDVQQTSELKELLSAVKTANSSLLEISMVIRSTPRRDDYIKAAARYSLDSRWDIGHVQEKFGSAQRSPDWLIQQLGRSITRRRQYLTYRKEHHGKLTRDWSMPLEDISDIKFDEELPEQTIALTKATTFVEVATNVQKDGSEVGSFGSQTSYEQTVAGESEQRQLTVPPPPQEAFDGVPFEFGKPFQCPYCYTEQSVKNRNAWKKHVFRDLRPYVCTFKECNLRMFRSRNEWFAHELQNHRREWMCPTCNKPFATKSSFRTHSQTHDPALAGSELEALALQCEEPINRFTASACTLCDEWEAQVTDPKQDGRRAMLNDGKDVKPYGTSGQFRRHLGRHMEQLALFALPREEGDLNEVDDGSIDATDSESDLENAEISPSAHALSPSGSSEGTTGPTPLYDLYGSGFDVNMPWTCCRCKRTMPSGLLVICTICKTGRCATCQQERVMDPERQSVSPTSSEYKRLIQEVEQNVIHARNVNIATQLVSPSNALGSKSEEVHKSNASLDHLTRSEQAVVGAAPLPISIDGQMHPEPHADMAMMKEERIDKEQGFHTQRPARLPLPPEDQTIYLGDEELIKKYAEEDAEESRQQRNDGTVPITFEWKAGGEQVSVAGSFTEWNKKTRLHPVYNQPGLHRAIIHIRPGRHHLRFIVDGVMKCSPDLPTTVDSGNNLVNHIEVGVPSEGENPQTTERKIKEVYATTDANLPLPENTDPNFYDNLEAGSQEIAPAEDDDFQSDDVVRSTSSAERDRYEPHQKIEPRQLTEEEEKENASIYELMMATTRQVADATLGKEIPHIQQSIGSVTDDEDSNAALIESIDDPDSVARRSKRDTGGEKSPTFASEIFEEDEESEPEEDDVEPIGRGLDQAELLQIRKQAKKRQKRELEQNRIEQDRYREEDRIMEEIANTEGDIELDNIWNELRVTEASLKKEVGLHHRLKDEREDGETKYVEVNVYARGNQRGRVLLMRLPSRDRQTAGQAANTLDTQGKTKIMPYYISPNPFGEEKRPIHFKDAVGRKFTFPFDHCNTWVGMEALIKQAFEHVDSLGPHVQEGHYDLVGPNGEIVLPQVWEHMIEPDWAVTMHMWPMPENNGRNKTGCLTCRKRRKKCDETKPGCMNCEKNSIACEGYPQKAIWKSGKEKAEEGKAQRHDGISEPKEKPTFLDISKRPWKHSDDQTLKTARERGMNWAEIHQKYFPGRTPVSCRKRHEMLMAKEPYIEKYSGGIIEGDLTVTKNSGDEKQAEHVSTSTRPPTGPWTVTNDQILVAARARDMRWTDIQREYFPNVTADECRERYEVLLAVRGKLAEYSSAQDKSRDGAEVAQVIDGEDQIRAKGMDLSEQKSFGGKLDTGYSFNSEGDNVGIAREPTVPDPSGFAERTRQPREDTPTTKQRINEEDKFNRPCDTLSVRNLPSDTDDSELRSVFFPQPGFRRMSFTQKHDIVHANVQFHSVAFATVAISELSGHRLSNSVNGGIVVVYARHPLGKRFESNEASWSESSGSDEFDVRGARISTSYWSIPEQVDFPALLERFGSDWHEIANSMGSKTHIMVRNYYHRRKDADKKDWEVIVEEADRRRARKKPTWALPRTPEATGKGTNPRSPPVQDSAVRSEQSSAFNDPVLGPWTVTDDEVLMAARTRNMPWTEIHQKLFPAMTLEDCRGRHELLRDAKESRVQFDQNKIVNAQGSSKEREIAARADLQAMAHRNTSGKARKERELVERARLQWLQEEEEDMRRRLTERQMPKRGLPEGQGSRRHRVLQDDGVYRWE